MGDLFEIGQVGATIMSAFGFSDLHEMALRKESTSQTGKVRVVRVVHFDDTPRVSPSSHRLAVNQNLLLGTDNRKWKKGTEGRVVSNSLLVIFFGVIGEVVDGNTIVLDIFHYLQSHQLFFLVVEIQRYTYTLLEIPKL